MHLPLVFMNGPWRMSMGLRNLEPGDWLWIDDEHAAHVAEHARLIAERRDVVIAALPGSEDACAELLEMVVDDLLAHHGRDHRALRADPDPLGTISRLVQEDFCLLQRSDEGSYVLRAGVLCFPLHWQLRDKLGLPLRVIHGPVPGFADRLGDPADRFFSTLTVERPVWRANWALTDEPELHVPARRGHGHNVTSGDAGERLWLRIERQTLRRLPRSHAVVFGIRTLVRRLDTMVGEPGVAAAIADRIREMPEAMTRYKGFAPMHGPLLAYLDRAAGRPVAEGAAAGG
ncbi:MAG: DUF3445 domain-containing protein [Geminicoccaceae bacterium]